MNIQAKIATVKMNSAIASEDKKALYLAVPFESAIFSDLSAYDDVFTEYVLSQQLQLKNALRAKLTQNSAISDKLYRQLNDEQKRLQKYCNRITARLQHVSGHKFNIVYECKKERSDKRKNKIADNDISLKNYATLVHSGLNLKSLFCA